MAPKPPSSDSSSGSATDNAFGEALLDSAQKIWLAGLGAFSRAQDEGDKMFEILVEQGRGVRGRARDAADQALKSVREQADSAAGEARSKWDKLEQAFEERVSRSLSRFGVLTRAEMDDLTKQVKELNQSVRSAIGRAAGAPARGATKKATRRSTHKAARGGAKKTTRRSTRKR